jgi:hypothetical protein
MKPQHPDAIWRRIHHFADVLDRGRDVLWPITIYVLSDDLSWRPARDRNREA